MIRNSVAGWTVGTLLCFCLAAATVYAQPQKAAELYGRGVSAYFSGDAQQAVTLLDKAIKLNPEDPRLYFFRGLARARQGDMKAAKADFAKGAQIEVTDQLGVYDVDDALQRIQGAIRIEIENQRRAARQAAIERRRKEERVRYEQLKRSEKDVLFNPNRPVPKIDFPIPKPKIKVDPFATGLVLTGGKQVAVKAVPALKPTSGAPSGAKPRDPFAAPVAGTAAKSANPFAAKKSTLPAPKAPKPGPAANPFGDLSPTPKAPATKPSGPSKASSNADPFGIGAAKPATSSGPAARTKKSTAAPADPFGTGPAKSNTSTKKKAAPNAAGSSSKKPASPPADDPFK